VGKVFTSFFVGAFLSAVICTGCYYYFAYRPSLDRIGELREQQQQTALINSRLAEQLAGERETIERARAIAVSSGTSIAKLKQILLLLKDSELDALGSNSFRATD
jgi:hypothetical protein